MSFVTSIRDYVETLNTITENLGQDLTWSSFGSETLLYILKTLQAGFIYIISFRWIRDFSLLPVVLPKMSTSVFKETFFLETPSQVFFDFLEIPDLDQNKFILGFFNSFFLTLPFSIVAIITVRRLLIQGIPAAVYSMSGYVIGQILFLACTLFGIRQILVPWLTFEPLSYVLGLILIFRILYSMTGESLVELKGWNNSKYKTFFLTSFCLAWCEQTSLFQYLGNVTASSNVTLLETFSSSSPLSNFSNHFVYLIGILVGCVVFSCLWGLFFLQLKKLCVAYTPLYVSSFIQLFNKTTFVITLALSLTSIPFYGFDYLFTGPLGFISQDSLFENTMFDQRNEKMKALDPRLSDLETNYKYLHLNVSAFDRGDYGTSRVDIKSLNFEDLNYRGELDWLGRSNYRGIADSRSSFFSLASVLKKQKPLAKELALESQILMKKERNIEIGKKPDFFEAEDFDIYNEALTTRIAPEDEMMPTNETIDQVKVYKQLYSTSFPVDYLHYDSTSKPTIEEKLKEKYYSNPIYKALLKLDIDLFLKRQPYAFQVSPEQEADLFSKRQILESYYNSLRDYSKIPYSEMFDSFFDGAKSFSSKVYNQQFKGTLRSVRRLFSLTLNNPEQNGERVLKFDQPLYNFSDGTETSIYHEELVNQLELNEKQRDRTSFTLLTKPLYAGWDEKSRKFVITNKLLPRKNAGYQAKIEKETLKQFSRESSKPQQKIKFTSWPLREPENKPTIPSVLLYEAVDENMKRELNLEADADIKSLPSNLERFKMVRNINQMQAQNPTQDSIVPLAPKRGGFIWPGNSKFSFRLFEQ